MNTYDSVYLAETYIVSAIRAARREYDNKTADMLHRQLTAMQEAKSSALRFLTKNGK